MLDGATVGSICVFWMGECSAVQCCLEQFRTAELQSALKNCPLPSPGDDSVDPKAEGLFDFCAALGKRTEAILDAVPAEGSEERTLLHSPSYNSPYNSPFKLEQGGPQTEKVTSRTRGGCGGRRARSHCRVALPLIHFIPDSLTYSVPLFSEATMRPNPRSPPRKPAAPRCRRPGAPRPRCVPLQPRHYI